MWFCVPDGQIGVTAQQFAERNWKDKIAIHSSGVLSSEALGLLRRKGANVASAHPLMTFVTGQVPDLSGVYFAIEGDKLRLAWRTGSFVTWEGSRFAFGRATKSPTTRSQPWCAHY